MKPNRIATTIILVVLIQALLTSCATIICGKQQKVEVESFPEKATATITSTSGRTIYSGITPFIIYLDSGDGYFNGAEYYVKYDKQGYITGNSHISNTINPWYVANIFNLFGFFLVDPWSGAMWKINDKTAFALKKEELE